MVAARETSSDLTGAMPWYRRLRESPTVARMTQVLSELLPKGLYARALLIIITPIVVLEGVIAFAFMERHWQAVTRRLSEATARDISALIEVYNTVPKQDGPQKIIDLARQRLGLTMEVLPAGDLPPPGPKPFFALLDRALSEELRRNVQLPFWIDTVGQTK
ncbi:MAG: two-component sensor histidine kinase, partial [Hyphomicrobium sp.]|nr:two-component sensor histidine kinase [Hyphomicrobium sp.]